MEHYHFHQFYIYKIREAIISDTVEFFLRKFPMPSMSSEDATNQLAQDLIHDLENMAPVATYNTIGTEQTAALRSLAEIFIIVQYRPIPAPTPRVVQDEAPQRANNDNISSPRVITANNPSFIAPMNQ